MQKNILHHSPVGAKRNKLENELKQLQYPESTLGVLGDVHLGQAEHEAKQSQLNYKQESLQSDFDQRFLGDSYETSESQITNQQLQQQRIEEKEWVKKH